MKKKRTYEYASPVVENSNNIMHEMSISISRGKEFLSNNERINKKIIQLFIHAHTGKDCIELCSSYINGFNIDKKEE